jgi:hypothetical protein
MANPTVEKLKALGIRHGEKAAVGLAALLCVLFLGLAIAKPTIDLTAEQVKGDADKADQNIKKPQSLDTILAQLKDSEKIIDTEFAKEVEENAKTALDASKFALPNPWTQPEPGAGRIRDTPELLAPTDLYARAGRGPLLVYKLDENGEKIVKVVKQDDQQKVKRKPRRRGRPRMGMGGYGGGYGMMGGRGQNRGAARQRKLAERAQAKEEAERKAKLEQLEKKERLVGGISQEQLEKEKQAQAEAEKKGKEDFEEETKGFRWVAVTGTFPHKQQRDNWAKALKIDFANANPNYLRLDVQRQVLGDDGQWGDWEDVNREANQDILFNIPETDEEITFDNVRLEALVDFLPFMRAGWWKGVHIAKFVPAKEREVEQKKEQPAGGAGGYGNSYASRMGSYGAPPGSMGGYPGGSMGGYGGSSGYGAMMRGGSGGYGGYGGGAMSAGVEEETNVPKTDAEEIMVRSLDFTVEPDTIYRYRVRIVVRNPNLNREDVNTGVDNKSEELTGPWSEPTDPVAVPADVIPFAANMNINSDQVHFQVARWNPLDGMTVVRAFDAGPGEVIGTARTVRVPEFDENAKEDVKSVKVDFNTHQMVLDTEGGQRPRPALKGMTGGAFYDTPALALLLRRDGKVVVRDQTVDARNDEMKEMQEIYEAALNEAEGKDKKQQQAGGYGGYGGSGGGYGAPGGGYGGMMPGGRR